MGKEIEKKYLVTEESLLNLGLHRTKGKVIIEQNYLAIGNEEVRIRKKVKDDEDKYTLTIKIGSGLEREEIENEITKETYKQINSNISTKPIIKYRETVLIDDLTLEIDTYVNEEFNELMVAEIEFNSIDEVNENILPNWAIQDITYDKSFKNQSLWNRLNVTKEYDGTDLE